ncbi:MAG: type IV secretion system DNA-binding domain-containing protein [Bacilli bacterium]|nr:type IV secretion system DNA-binding domain-containing protein [Bacilli bacterium]MBQ8218649.1 type IV secretion system DNA-binding domain-containing protein [Bacilli bacterium]
MISTQDMLLKSLIGLCILLVIAIENLVLCRKKTIPVMLLDQIFFGIVIYYIFGWITIIYSFLLTLFLLFIKYRNHIDDGADLDYSGRIFSISAVINRLHKPKELVIGRVLPVNHNEIKYNMKAIELDNTVLSGETFITGSTGSGKTTTMKTILKQRIDEGKPVVFFDYKGEEDILDEMKSFAEAANLPYYEFSARACTFTYDPFINLDETGKVEALMNTRRWSTDGADEHYKTSMQLAIQNLIRDYDIYRNEHNETKNYIAGLYEYAKTYKPQSNERDGFNNLLKSLEILLSSKAKLLFGDDPEFTFERDEPYVVCFSFTSSTKALANNISSFVFTDIMDRGTRRKYPDKLLLCVDEFGTLDSSILIKDLLEKGRSGGVQTVFSILDVNQIAMNAGEHFVQAILGTINNYIIHAGATQQTAELLAGVQKFDKSYDIMSLRKPYKGAIGTFKPTALFISKYPILNKKGTQEVYRIAPYSEILKKMKSSSLPDDTDDEDNVEEDIIEIPADQVDLSMPIDNVDQYL